jgi:hypothetical protein
VSVQALSWVLEESQASGHARLVLLALANHASSRGHNACCGFHTIGREAKVSRSTVIRCLDELEALGEVLIYPQKGVQGRGGKTNRYELPQMAGWEAPEGIGPPRLDPCGYHSASGVTLTTVPNEVVSGGSEVVSKTRRSGVTADTRTLSNRSMNRVPEAWKQIADWDFESEETA